PGGRGVGVDEGAAPRQTEAGGRLGGDARHDGSARVVGRGAGRDERPPREAADGRVVGVGQVGGAEEVAPPALRRRLLLVDPPGSYRAEDTVYLVARAADDDVEGRPRHAPAEAEPLHERRVDLTRGDG